MAPQHSKLRKTRIDPRTRRVLDGIVETIEYLEMWHDQIVVTRNGSTASYDNALKLLSELRDGIMGTFDTGRRRRAA